MTLDVTRLVWLDARTARFVEPTDRRWTFRFLGAEDIREFSEDPTHGIDASWADRLEEGDDFCFAAIWEDRLAAYAWFALHAVDAQRNRGRQENTGVGLAYPHHVAFMYKGFTHPDFRGRGLYGVVNGLAADALAGLGIRHLLSTMDWTNVAARRSCRRLGFTELGRIYRWGWGRWMHTHLPPAAQPLARAVNEVLS